ncbi:MAG: hypothetical protein ACI3XQ_11325 [Eubacteriales bacterium]
MDMAISAYREYARLKANQEKSEILRADEEAVTIALSSMTDEEENAVTAIYMSGVNEKINGKIIASRVRRYAYEKGWSESSVWRMLKRARRLYAVARGLI